MRTKTCSSCKEIKLLNKFRKQRNYRGGFTCWCKLCELKYQKQRQKRVGSPSWWLVRFWHHKGHSKDRGIESEITMEEFKEIWLIRRCHYCDATEEMRPMSIERKNAELGYIYKNCVLACTACNLTKEKRGWSYEQMKIVGEAISIAEKIQV
jgi:hypothetical protein